MNDLSTRELFTQLQSKLIVQLNDNEQLCPKCKGLRFILVESDNQAHIKSCSCYTGKVHICKYCNEPYSQSQCKCHATTEEIRNDFDIRQAKKEQLAYDKADKIKFADYDGKFLLDSDEYVKDKEDIEEWIYAKIMDNEDEDIPDYLWATESDKVFSIDLSEVISDKCEDGYDEMYARLDTGSGLLTLAQELISQWEDEQGESMNVYSETYKVAVLLGDIVDEIKSEILERR